MKFSELILSSQGEVKTITGGNFSEFTDELKIDFEINKLCYNSKLVEYGDVFFAIKGFTSNGNDYIEQAISGGAMAVISDEKGPQNGHPVYRVDDARKAMAVMSNIYYGFPSRKMNIIGITGTNGKTTVAHLINHVLELEGKHTGLIGTNGNVINKRFFKTEHTTPESIELNSMLNMMADENVEYVTMEVSSHALALKRVYGIDFDIGIFTNLSSDHLDFHKTMEDYFRSKKILFDSIERINKKGNKTAVIYNVDDEYSRKIINGSEAERVSYGFQTAAYSIDGLKMSFDGMKFDILIPLNGEGKDRISIKSKLTGRFNVYNILASVSALRTLGLSYKAIRKGVEDFEPVEGRFNRIKLTNKASAIIDYSHTPDGLLKALVAIKEIMGTSGNSGKIITVFGCGGNRDRSKRPVMGHIAAENSDHVIVTSDNPRFEEPLSIIEEIKAGIRSDNYEIEEDREKAIEKAIEISRAGDVILIAGKGHEDYQEIRGVKYHLIDKEIVEKFI
jgi:UDP-N-acetylmuramoyl-L-alanyl-D-glutamate--2,6-diaminopimelate ligase